jgi:hypothetical protein
VTDLAACVLVYAGLGYTAAYMPITLARNGNVGLIRHSAWASPIRAAGLRTAARTESRDDVRSGMVDRGGLIGSLRADNGDAASRHRHQRSESACRRR